MPFNLIKVYNNLLEITHLSERNRKKSLQAIFDRDIVNNNNFKFRNKTIRPLKIDGEPALDTLFLHLTHKAEDVIDENGKKYKSRTLFDRFRSERLHWLRHHIEEKINLLVFSHKDRVDGRNKVRTYLYNREELYVIVLEPYRKTPDYYLLSAYYLDEKGGDKKIMNKYKRRLDEIY